ncbi:MAG: type II secretion system F family protein [Burkholderiales bacterium]|nr:type II secretion system F family protein [Burkholderiales bacterium]
MPLFRYKAVATNGEMLEGVLEARAPEAVVERLQAMGYVTLRAEEATAEAAVGELRRRRRFARPRIGSDQLVTVTRELAALLNAGLALDRALEVMNGLAEDEAVRNMLLRVRDEVRGGTTLSAALANQSGIFSRLYLSMVRAGEAGGALAKVLLRLSEHLERADELRATVVSALIYPIILIAVSAISVMTLLIFVVPQFTQLLEESGKALPLSTQIIVSTGNILRAYWWAILIALAGAVFLFRRRLEVPAARLRWDAWLLRLPIAGELIAKVEVARFARTLATLVGNGVALLPGLSIARETLGNTVLADALARVAAEVKAGRGLGRPLLREGVFPKLAVHMVMVGEETGRLEETLLRVAEVYDKEVERSLKRALALLEPALILGLAVVIAAIILSILLALLSVNELAR